MPALRLTDAIEAANAALGRDRPDLASLPKTAATALLTVAGKRDRGETADARKASELARMLMGCYRARDFVDPVQFAAALAVTFARHTEEVGLMVVDPTAGMPRTHRFPPSIAEVADELDRRSTHLGRLARAIGRGVGKDAA